MTNPSDTYPIHTSFVFPRSFCSGTSPTESLNSRARALGSIRPFPRFKKSPHDSGSRRYTSAKCKSASVHAWRALLLFPASNNSLSLPLSLSRRLIFARVEFASRENTRPGCKKRLGIFYSPDDVPKQKEHTRGCEA